MIEYKPISLHKVNTLSYKTISASKETVQKEWIVVDAQGEVLGRLASQIARLIRGKHKTNFTPHVDCGDNVIVINAEKVRLTGSKMTDKVYVRHTGYPGGQRFASPRLMLEKHPERIIEHAVKGYVTEKPAWSAVVHQPVRLRRWATPARGSATHSS